MSSFPPGQLDALSVQLSLPDLWQQDAVRALKAGHDVIVDAPTGAGKTRVFELFARGEKLDGQAVYTVPTRALANDKRTEWERDGWEVGIATGDLAEAVDAPVLVATLETQRERLLRGDSPPALLVIDEYQMIGHPSRGLNYELAVALADPERTRLLLLSGSVANPEAVATWLRRLGREVTLVRHSDRPVPLDEVSVEQLPMRPPRQVNGFWQRTAAAALMGNLGPLLIFAPQRSAAERTAKKIAASLPNTSPLELTRDQVHACGPELAKLLARRVAYHHSGLPYAARAGVIEPLAKAGQLRVVVATTGLAAGINFSMRSVLVADTRFTDAYGAERDLAADDLLQMFGRAGRRGLDESGYVITTRTSPSLADSAQSALRRTNVIDWPSLLRAMGKAAATGESPFEAARALGASLFSEQRIALGFGFSSGPTPTGGDTPAQAPEAESDAGSKAATAPEPAPDRGAHASAPATPVARGNGAGNRDRDRDDDDGGDGDRLFGFGPTRTEIFNSRGHWEPKDPDNELEVELELTTIYFRNYLEPALAVFEFVANSFPRGRVCRIEHDDGFHYYGKELAIAVKHSDGLYHLTKNIRSHLGIPASDGFTYDQLEDQVLDRLDPEFLMGGQITDVVLRGDQFTVRLDFLKTPHLAYRDSFGVYLIEAEERSVSVEIPATIDAPSADSSPVPATPRDAARLAGATDGTDDAASAPDDAGPEPEAGPASGGPPPRFAAANSPAEAWRKLGLIESDGRPTRRGEIFSFFQRGEGLAVAAALEDESYESADLVADLANLRAGRRFENFIPSPSERLSTACRAVYGTANHQGYLSLGVPPDYGPGAAEAVALALERRGKAAGLSTEETGTGDIERAVVEWLSILRHIVGAPGTDWDRWANLQETAAAALRQFAPATPTARLPELPAEQRHGTPKHRLYFREF